MESSIKLHETSSLLPSPKSYSPNNSSSSSSSSNNTNPPAVAPPPPQQQQVKPITRSECANPYPTTFVQADSSSFKQVVQMLTGSSETVKHAAAQPEPNPKTHIPPIKSIPRSKQQSGFKLYERRSSLKNLKINPLKPLFAPNSAAGFSPRKHEILSPSILDFPALVLSPVTPLIPDPFDRSGAPNPQINNSPINHDGRFTPAAEERAIKEKGFYLHPSPKTTPRDSEPRLLPLFPVTSPRVSGSSAT